MFSDDHRCFWIFSGYSIDVLLMFSRCSLDVPRMIAGFFQDDHFKWKIERNSMIPNYSMIPAFWWSPAIWWSIESMDFDNPKFYGDTSITDGLVVSYCPITKASTNYRQRKGGGPNFVWVEPPVGIRAPMLCPCPLIGTSTPPPPHSRRPHLLLLSSPSSSTVIGHCLPVYFLIGTS